MYVTCVVGACMRVSPRLHAHEYTYILEAHRRALMVHDEGTCRATWLTLCTSFKMIDHDDHELLTKLHVCNNNMVQPMAGAMNGRYGSHCICVLR